MGGVARAHGALRYNADLFRISGGLRQGKPLGPQSIRIMAHGQVDASVDDSAPRARRLQRHGGRHVWRRAGPDTQTEDDR